MDEVAIISVCLFLNAILAAYEMAFVSVPRPELRKIARSGNKYAKTLLSLRDSPERTLAIIQIGITMLGAIAAAVGGAGASDFIEPYLREKFGFPELLAESIGVIAVVLPITYLSVVIGELVPKTLALRNPTKIVLSGAKWLLIADRILSPIVTLLEWSTKKLLATTMEVLPAYCIVRNLARLRNPTSRIGRHYLFGLRLKLIATDPKKLTAELDPDWDIRKKNLLLRA